MSAAGEAQARRARRRAIATRPTRTTRIEYGHKEAEA
jgi:hypothetical protein